MTEQKCPKCGAKGSQWPKTMVYSCGSTFDRDQFYSRSRECERVEAAYNRGVQAERMRSILEKARCYEPLKPTFFTVTPTQFDWIKDQLQELEND